MDTENLSVPPCAPSDVADDYPPAGVIHDNVRHTTRFTVVGNHLAQHSELSGLAIGVAVHIQSLPTGTPSDIKSVARRLREGTTRVAAAMRELEAHGYLRRERTRSPDGRILTRTVSCNQPGATRQPRSPHAPKPRREATAAPRKRALPAVPKPSCPAPALIAQAIDVLAGLRRHDSRLLLSEDDAAHLAPGVAAWLERDVSPAAVRQALTTGLPLEDLRRPAALLAHRLTDRLPPAPPFRAPAAPPPPPLELRNCDGCDRGFRAPQGVSHCRDCRTANHP
ncbi:helix-turn-helix domain-containing protein [Streptomyces sp. NPDC023723]|uniref:helix-turn-helix domain-containing protein n=1 Tax=Streptomyces sp. NPDC023723 TaxID=3154323 RepID=UPI00340AB805